MLWAIYCVDKPNTATIRAEVRERHWAYLKGQKGILVLAGATQSDDGKVQTGSLFVVNVGSRAEAKAFSDADPLTQSGVFANLVITRMRKGMWNPEAADGAEIGQD